MTRMFALFSALFAIASIAPNSGAVETPRPANAPAPRQQQALIVGQSPDGHPALSHEFMAGAHVVAELLKKQSDINPLVVNADDPWPDGPKLIDQADGLIMLVSQGSRWMQTNKARAAAIKRLADRGGAIVALHWSVGAKDAEFIPGQLALLGATRGGEQRKWVVSEGHYKRVNSMHPILAGIPDFTAYDEHYYNLDRRPDVTPLLTVKIDGKDEMVAWAFERHDGGRSFGFVGLHFHANWQLPVYRKFVVQGVRWAMKLPIPPGGVSADIDQRDLEIDGKLPPLSKPASAAK